ncbi:MAG: hypothetical protein AAF437_11195 [Pseudomonadota bacterium]
MNTLNRSFLKPITVLIFAGLTACASGPQYRTDTSYVAPATTQGATCVASCQTSEQVCRSRQEDNARAEYPACMQRAKDDYKVCMSGQMTGNCAIFRTTSEQACGRRMQPSYKTCVSSYNACYQSCGGEVKQKTVCVKNCD